MGKHGVNSPLQRSCLSLIVCDKPHFSPAPSPSMLRGLPGVSLAHFHCRWLDGDLGNMQELQADRQDRSPDFRGGGGGGGVCQKSMMHFHTFSVTRD